MLVQVEGTGEKGAQETVHRKVEGRVVPLDGFEQVTHFDFRGKFFSYLANEGFLRGFSGFDLASRELPPAFEVAVTSLRGEYLSVTHHHCSHHFYRLDHDRLTD